MSNKDIRKLQKLAKKRLELRNDPRFVRVIEVLRAYGLLVGPDEAPPRSSLKKISFDEIYFAGELEARVFEVLPALLIRHPSVIADPWAAPTDLKEILKEIREGKAQSSFRGIPAKNYLKWVEEFKRANSRDRLIRMNFRFSQEDKSRMDRLRKKLKVDSTAEIIRRALVNLENATPS